MFEPKAHRRQGLSVGFWLRPEQLLSIHGPRPPLTQNGRPTFGRDCVRFSPNQPARSACHFVRRKTLRTSGYWSSQSSKTSSAAIRAFKRTRITTAGIAANARNQPAQLPTRATTAAGSRSPNVPSRLSSMRRSNVARCATDGSRRRHPRSAPSGPEWPSWRAACR